MEFVDSTGALHVHMLRFETIPNSPGCVNVEDCIHLGKAFVQRLIDCLNERFTDLPIFNATKFFSHRSYFEEKNERDSELQYTMKS